MTRKSIVTSQVPVACEVCGRTLLRGEQAEVFLSGGSRRMVCELCGARAAHEGWIREGGDDAVGVRPRHDRGRSLLGRLRQRGDDAVREARGRRNGGDPVEAPGGEPSGRAPGALAVPARREPRHVRAVPTNADLKMARALDVFNGSEHPRTVAGVARSLGAPFVVVRPSDNTGAMVSILVGWELCWYRYEVDLADESAGVRVVGQGLELSELGDDDHLPNAAADSYGELVPVA